MNEIPNYGLIKCFVKVVELKNITSAANELFVSQPTLSRYIARFEEEMGLALFKRIKSGMEITSEGRLVYSHCKKLLAAYDEFILGIAEINDIIVGTINIGYQSMSKGLITYFNSRVHTAYPHIQMQSIRQSKDNFLDEIIAGNLDLAYMYGHEFGAGNKIIDNVFVKRWEKRLMVSKTHPLALREKIHISELGDEVFIQTSQLQSPVKTREFFEACRNNGFEPNVLFYVNSFNEALVNVITYNAVSIMPYFESSDELIHNVSFIEIEGMDTDYPIHLVWSKANVSPIVSYYVEVVKRELQKDVTDTIS